jgi:adenine-specific DNA methylase
MDQRYIENYFPVSEVSGTYRIREISSLHKWWARGSLESSSAVIYSSLISSSDDNEIKESIIKLAGREGSDITEIARENILKTFEIPPKVLDPYAGGGSIPFEALRLGCETYANDYNPVAVLIEKCLLENPEKMLIEGFLASTQSIK